ncbi:hypothetical protein [Pseudomonas aeruginosa]|uniref:hypothetical protein n=1 Tax=Pseudomonas aeruginosa TaxID=287 RepID=UPI00376F99FA|nr:hypothetical protein [Pseudomonas aeruginosa]
MSFGTCADTNNNPIVVAEELGRKLVINNNSRQTMSKVRVDGCVVTDNSLRCDYLFELGQPMEKVIYLELKGRNVEHAYEQLCATVTRFSVRHRNLEKECRIIASRVPRMGTRLQQMKVEMLKKYGASLLVNTTKSEIFV